MVWILAVFVVAVVWGLGFVLPFPLGLKLAVTGAAILLVVGVVVLRRWRARRAAAALERELLRQAEAQQMSARPDRRAEIAQVKARMEEGIRALKSSRLGAGGSALYALPWYAILGPPGGGKTTALRNSGLKFAFLDGERGSVQGLGGTRNCDWWFADEAVLLDTAGRFATEVDDQDEWFAFLDLLRRYRSRQPLNGLLVAVSVADLLQGSEEQVDALAAKLRSRVDEVINHLQTQLPVYVLVTKADLISGFVEYWDDLRKSERDQVWGFTLPVEGKSVDPVEAFRAEFDLLQGTLHSRVVQRIGQARQPSARDKTLAFPLEFGALEGVLVRLVGVLFARNAYQETPAFRGLYFTSGTQEGSPIDRVVSEMSRAFGLPSAPGAAPDVRHEPKSYFLTDVFRKVVFPDRLIATRTARERRRQALMRLAFGLSAVLLSLAIAVPAFHSFGQNRLLGRELRDAAVQAAQVSWKPGLDAVRPATLLDPLRSLVLDMNQWQDERPPLRLRWGLYTGSVLRPAAIDGYGGLLRRQFESPVRASLESRLRSIAAPAEESLGSYNTSFEHLKMYLMLSDPQHLDLDWATPRLTRIWGQVLGARTPEAHAALGRHVRTYLELLKRGDVAPLPAELSLVTYARSQLLRVPRVSRTYEALIRDANVEVAPIRREDIFYGPVSAYVTSKKNLMVRGAYTRLGWNRVRTLLESEHDKLAAERWVLGEEQGVQDDPRQQVAQLRQLYFQRYRDEWTDFLRDLEVRRPETAVVAREELLALVEPEWPYSRLLRVVAENTRLETEAGPKQSDAVLDRAQYEVEKRVFPDAGPPPRAKIRPKSAVEQAFEPMALFGVPVEVTDPAKPAPPTGLSQYVGTLKKLVGMMSDLQERDAPPDPKEFTGAFEEAYRTTAESLADQTAFTRPLLRPLLLNPITFSWGSVLKDSGGAAGGLWEVDVWQQCVNKLQGRYPFADAPQDASLEDFAEFYRPDTGLLWAFFDQNLKPLLQRQGTTFVPQRRFDESVPFSGDFLTFLSQSQAMTRVLFDAGAQQPHADFRVRLHSVSSSVSEVMLEIDGEAHTYRNEPEEWVSVRWPAPKATVRGARLRVRGFSGLEEVIPRPGDFGLFRLLAAAKVAPAEGGRGERTLVVTWVLRTQSGQTVTMHFKPAREAHPFGPGFFPPLQCPRLLMAPQK